LEAQLTDRGVTIEVTDPAADWIAETGYDEKFGARPLARVIQEHIKKPLADEVLFGKLQHGGAVKVRVEGEGLKRHLAFEFFPADPATRPKSKEEDDDDVAEGEEDVPALVDAATPKKALPSPRDRKPKASGSVPGVPRKKDE
jgi:ATP-dependent Clp protease ATP-binding subunit ClpA